MSTIVGIATAPGIGGIGIIRMSGEKTFEILDKIFIPKTKQDISEIKGYSIKYGNVVENNKIIDEVLVSYFKAPKSYTTENMCEINAHGGNIVVKKILELCLANGAEMAGPGEFTKRAFFNGRIDLAQAESVIDVINAKSEREAKSGIKQLEGFLSAEINQIKQDILDVLVNIEVTIDYPEYDTPEVQENELKNMLNKVENKLEKLEKSFDNGKIIKDGIKTAIIGKPNAGKSSLLNAILKEDRAIVTDIAGTTRDTIEEYVTINGIALKLIDTAGIREAKDSVEKIGIQKSIEEANDADLIIAIFDSSKELDDEDYEILKLIKNKKSIILLNKNDLKNVIDENNEKIVDGEGIFLLINIDKRRAVRIPDDQYTAYGVELDEKSDIKIEKLEKLQEVTSKNFFKVRYGDIDSNMHVNNVRYVEWAVESLPLEIVLNYELKDLSVVFEKECKYGAEIIASYELREDNDELIVLHKIENDEGTELSILKSRWIKLKN